MAWKRSRVRIPSGPPKVFKHLQTEFKSRSRVGFSEFIPQKTRQIFAKSQYVKSRPSSRRDCGFTLARQARVRRRERFALPANCCIRVLRLLLHRSEAYSCTTVVRAFYEGRRRAGRVDAVLVAGSPTFRVKPSKSTRPANSSVFICAINCSFRRRLVLERRPSPLRHPFGLERLQFRSRDRPPFTVHDGVDVEFQNVTQHPTPIHKAAAGWVVGLD